MKALLTKQKTINKVILIPEYKIKPNPYQPRKVFDDEKIDQLATSIAQYGLLQPITVLPTENGDYQLVAGERRLLACRKLKMQEVPDQVPEDVKRRRVERLVDLQSGVMDAWNEARLGTVMEVLCEGFDPDMGCWAGRTYADSVDVDGHVYFTAGGMVPAGSFVNVRITGTADGDLTGEIEE